MIEETLKYDMAITRHSVCALDCPDACSLLINIDGNGRGSRLRGNPDHPVTQGALCAKVARYLDREYSPERLTTPLRRIPGAPKGRSGFEPVSWDAALDEISAKLRETVEEYGSESILPYSYAGTMGYLNFSGMAHRFFHRLGASRLDRTICSSAGGAGLMDALGVRYGTEPEQVAQSKLIIAWGSNIQTTNMHLWPFIVQARRNGARFVVIDPHRNRTAAHADRHYAIHPGSDTALAFALMHVILTEGLEDRNYVANHTVGVEELKQRMMEWTPARAAALTGIPAEEIVALAREYAATRPAFIRLGYGLQRSDRGAMAVRAVALLPALTGSWSDVGGGLQLSTSGAFLVNRNALEMPELQYRSGLGREARIVNMTTLGHALTGLSDPPVKALIVYNSNPAAIAPDQNAVRAGLRRDDLFTVVIDQFENDSTDFADIVLPATTFLEHTDLYYAYGHYYMQLARPVLAAPGEALSNVEIFRRLALRMGFDDPCFRDSEDDMIRATLASGHPFLDGITLEALDREHSIRLQLPSPFRPFAPDAEGKTLYGTPSGKCEFRAETLAYEPPVESRSGDRDLLARYPLELISPKNHDNMNSTFGNRPANVEATGKLTIHPADALLRGIATGDEVAVHNDRGTIRLTANVVPEVSEGVVCCPAVGWPRLGGDGNNVNMLTSQRLTDKGAAPTFYSCLVQVEKIS